jgi:hypothetical protein
MKSSLMRPAMALALALGLAACGGDASFPVNVTVQGLQYPGLVLTTNGSDLPQNPPATAGADVTGTFPKQLGYGDVFNVTVKQDPQFQHCSPGGIGPNGIPVSAASTTDTAGRLAQINAYFTCTVNHFTIGGKVTGLKADGLVLANGSTGGTLTVAKDATTFEFTANPVNYGVTYGVTVLTNPTGQTCTVANGTNVMPNAQVTNIAVTCI